MLNLKKIKIINIIKLSASTACYRRAKLKKNNNHTPCFIALHEVDGYMMNAVYAGKVYPPCGGVIANN